MTQKERLVELIQEYYTRNRSEWEVELFESYMKEIETPGLANYLLSNGVIVPPCKVGDEIYRLIYNRTTNSPTFAQKEMVIDRFDLHKIDTLWMKEYFPTREEAEKALKEAQNG